MYSHWTYWVVSASKVDAGTVQLDVRCGKFTSQTQPGWRGRHIHTLVHTTSGWSQVIPTSCAENARPHACWLALPKEIIASWGALEHAAKPLLRSINQSIDLMSTLKDVLGGNWDPTDKNFSSVNSYRQDLLPTCKAFPYKWLTSTLQIGRNLLQPHWGC